LSSDLNIQIQSAIGERIMRSIFATTRLDLPSKPILCSLSCVTMVGTRLQRYGTPRDDSGLINGRVLNPNISSRLDVTSLMGKRARWGSEPPRRVIFVNVPLFLAIPYTTYFYAFTKRRSSTSGYICISRRVILVYSRLYLRVPYLTFDSYISTLWARFSLYYI
jgi:hypothetical protein